MANTTTQITLCHVLFTPTNQLFFETVEEQIRYFNKKKEFESESNKYQPRAGTMRVKGWVEEFSNVNYGYYTNTYNGRSKTFYFWIVKKDMIARNTTELTIQIDVIQTWMFDWVLQPCLIERAHVSSDEFGEHTIPEDFELGDYITASTTRVDELTGDVCYMVGVTDVAEGHVGSKFGKLYSGYQLTYFHQSATTQLNTFITNLAKQGKADAIGFIFSFPDALLKQKIPFIKNGDTITGMESIIKTEVDVTNLTNVFTWGNQSYVPKNNKLYCYPFNFLTITNAGGSNTVYKFENFAGGMDDITFFVETVLSQNPIVSIRPESYSGKPDPYEDSLETRGWGLCSWNNDNYSNWYAQNSNTIKAQSTNAIASYRANASIYGNSYANTLNNANLKNDYDKLNASLQAVGGLTSMLSGNIGGGLSAMAGAGSSYVGAEVSKQITTNNANTDLSNASLLNTTNYQNSIRSILASVQDASVQPNTCKGDTSGSGLDITRGSNTFFIRQTMIKPEYARMIDLYFQMYGYQLNLVDYPDLYINTRARWNYLKTVGMHIMGDVPLEDATAISQLFDNGITFFYKEEYLFNYNVVNQITV